ncbi:class I tRNA ligase family protein [bacterium]|nr:class I tRNA ligase family protein [bacterium]
MTEKNGNFYLSTAIHYANAAPHVGHAYEAVLGDIIARYERSRGRDVFFVSGTDEHGEKNIRAAAKAGLSPEEFVGKNSAFFRDLYRELGLGEHAFIRTSDKEMHWPGAALLWKKIEAAGDLYKGVYKGLYCVGCESFKLPKELKDGKCPDHNTYPESIQEENYFFRLSRYRDKVKALLETGEIAIIPAFRKAEVLSFLEEGAEDISFSRYKGEIPWGVPVPNDDEHVMYVWCDALASYISALGFGRENEKKFEAFWPADIHLIGKDILRFHAVIWPAMLLSAGLPLPRSIMVHGMVLSGGHKMSKTIGNVIDPREYIARYGKDAFRYYLGREISPFEDGDFTEEKFIRAYNANLANGLGNFAARVIAMAEKYFGGKIGQSSEDVPLLSTTQTVLENHKTEWYSIPYVVEHITAPHYHGYFENREMHKAFDEAWSLLSLLDGYITDYEPFKLIKTNPEKTQAVIWNLLYGLFYVADFIAPLMPDTAETLKEHIGAKIGTDGVPESFEARPLPAPLFARIETKEGRAEK